MLLAQTIVFYCTIWWFCFLERAKVMSWYIFSASTSGSLLQTRHSDQSTVRFSFTLQTERQWQEVLELLCPLGVTAFRDYILYKFSIRVLTHCTYRERESERAIISEQSVVILIPGRQYVITGEMCDFAVVIKSTRSPHLPLVWLFQHCSSSGSVSLPLAQMSSGKLDQNLLDSLSFSLMSITCHGPKQWAELYYISNICPTLLQ